MATWAAKLRPSAVDGQTIRVLPDGRIRGNAGMEPFSAGTKGGAPSVFYVDGNVVSSGNGLGWLSAFKTLTEGLVAAQTYQSTSGNMAWAHRATVYVCGDDLAETIVAWAQKTDVIGVGSDDGNKGPRILGHHVVTAYNVSTANYIGCRLFNITFKPSTTTVIFDVPDAQGGFEFHNCKWEWSNATSCTTGIRLTTCNDVVIDNCRFVKGTGTGFSTAAIQVATGEITQTIISNNYIDANIGIDVNSGTTGEGNLIYNNLVIAVGLTIDENSNVFYCIDNRCISEAGQAENTTWDMNEAKSSGNLITANNGMIDIPNMA